MEKYIELKGVNGGLMITLNAQVSFDLLKEDLLRRLELVKDFFSDGQYGAIIKGRILSTSEKISIENVISKVAGREVSIIYEVGSDSMDTGRVNNGNNPKGDKFHYGTLRSGQAIHSYGNLVVVGDVNPGAELIAVGNVVVMGTLRGIVHAGCEGNREAFVTAIRLSPTQLRIADIITRPPDNEQNTNLVPEIAYIKDNNIYIDSVITKH